MWPANPWTRSYRQEGSVAERTAGWLSGSCVLLRREAWDSVDGFDPRYFMYFEDVDLGDRLGRAGWLNVYVPDAEVVHTGGHATERDAPTSSRMLAEHHRSAYRFLADRYRGAPLGPGAPRPARGPGPARPHGGARGALSQAAVRLTLPSGPGSPGPARSPRRRTPPA